MYTVKVNGHAMELMPVRVSAIPFNRTWPGYQRDISQSEIAYVLYIESDDTAEVSLSADMSIESAKIRPQSADIHPNVYLQTIDFKLSEHGQYVLEVNGEHHAIHIFYDKPEDYSSGQSATHVYTSGEHHIGKLELGDNESIYIGKNAVLYANIFAVGKKNIRVFGHGILNGSDEIRTEKNGDIGWDGETSFSKEKLHTLGCLRLIDCKDIIIDGITITDSSSYAASIYASDNININNVKVVGHWKYNNDGIDLFNCSNSIISNSFIRSFDDTICIKGISAFSDKNCENIHVNNCILWCGWGKTLEIGVATAAREIKNITFENCNLIHNQHICISIANGQFAQISDVYYKNLNIEYEYVDCGMYQTDDAMAFEHSKRQLPTLISISDGRRNWQGNIASDSESRSIRNVVFDNINLICDDDIMPQVCLRRYNEVGVFDNIIIGTLRKNGKSLMKNVDVTNGIQ